MPCSLRTRPCRYHPFPSRYRCQVATCVIELTGRSLACSERPIMRRNVSEDRGNSLRFRGTFRNPLKPGQKWWGRQSGSPGLDSSSSSLLTARSRCQRCGSRRCCSRRAPWPRSSLRWRRLLRVRARWRVRRCLAGRRLLRRGTDASDCTDSCRYARDGECYDAARGGTGYCTAGTDCTDCLLAQSGCPEGSEDCW